MARISETRRRRVFVDDVKASCEMRLAQWRRRGLWRRRRERAARVFEALW
jgi:hypothetical protein